MTEQQLLQQAERAAFVNEVAFDLVDKFPLSVVSLHDSENVPMMLLCRQVSISKDNEPTLFLPR